MRRSQVGCRGAADATEKTLLAAKKAAQAAYERGSLETRPLLREAYLHALRAVNAYMMAHDAVSAKAPEPPRIIRPDWLEAERCPALMAVCGLA